MPTAADVTMRRWLVRVEGTATIATAIGASVLALVAALVAGWSAAGSVALGATVVLVFFALGAFIDARALRRAEPMAGVVVIGSYALRLAALTLVATWLVGAHWLASVTWFGAGVACSAMAWVVGMIIGHVTGRWPIYDGVGGLA